MTNWVSQTYWIQTEGKSTHAVVADKEAVEILSLDQLLVPVLEYPPCKECVHINQCMDSVWNEGKRTGGPFNEKNRPISFVHTCRTCGERVFSYLGNLGKETPKVDPGCPRWNATHGSALDCAACLEARSVLRKQNPRYAEQHNASKHMLDVVLQQNIESLRDLSLELVEAFSPRLPVGDPVELDRAEKVLGVLLEDIARKFPLNIQEDPTTILGWQETIFVSLRRGSSYKEVVRDFLLVFTDVPNMSRCWISCSVPERKMILRGWEGLVRQAMTNG